ncbi:MAG: hypothetical protein ABSF26_04285 [Thermoguttaceae bacterium]
MFANKLRGDRRLGRPSKTRNLRVEQLEQRALLSVTVLPGAQYKDVVFTVKGPFSALVGVSEFGRTVKAATTGVATVTGDMQYTSPTAGANSAPITVEGTVKSPTLFKGSGSLTGNVGTLTDTSGKVAWQVVMNSPLAGTSFSGSGSFNVTSGVVSLTMPTTTVDGATVSNGKFSGKIVQTPTQPPTPFNVQLVNPKYTAGTPTGTLTVPVTVPGPAHLAKSELASVATLTFKWAENAAGKAVPKAKNPTDTITIPWNLASETATVNGLTPPTGATYIIITTKFDKTTHTAAVPLLSTGSASASAALTDAAQSSEKKDAELGPQAVDQVLAMYS